MKIKLTQGKFTIVGLRDYTYLMQWGWCYSSCGYAVRTDGQQKILMHRVILERMGFKNFAKSDHINRNKLDNRRCNLRPATKYQSNHNRNRLSNNTSGYTGVSWCKRNKKWRAYITINRKQKFLGYYDDIKEAVRIRDAAALKYYKEFAVLNGV